MKVCPEGAILNDKELSVIESALHDAIEYTHSLIETEFRPNRLTHDDEYRKQQKHRSDLISSWQTSIRAIQASEKG